MSKQYTDNYRKDDFPPIQRVFDEGICYSVKDTAKLLGYRAGNFTNMIGKGIIPRAEITKGKSKFYTQIQVDALKEFIRVYSRYKGRAVSTHKSQIENARKKLVKHFKESE